MSGEQGTIRAIRVICAENGLQDWPQRGAEGTKRRRRLKPLISAHRRSSRTAECPRNTRNTRKAEPGRLAAKRRKKGERRSDFFTEFTEPCHRGRRRLKAKTAKCRERSVNPRNPRETLGRLLRIIFLPTKSAYPKSPIPRGRKRARAGRFCSPGGRRAARRFPRSVSVLSSLFQTATLGTRLVPRRCSAVVGRTFPTASTRGVVRTLRAEIVAVNDIPASTSFKCVKRASISCPNSAEMLSLMACISARTGSSMGFFIVLPGCR